MSTGKLMPDMSGVIIIAGTYTFKKRIQIAIPAGDDEVKCTFECTSNISIVDKTTLLGEICIFITLNGYNELVHI